MKKAKKKPAMVTVRGRVRNIEDPIVIPTQNEQAEQCVCDHDRISHRSYEGQCDSCLCRKFSSAPDTSAADKALADWLLDPSTGVADEYMKLLTACRKARGLS